MVDLFHLFDPEKVMCETNLLFNFLNLKQKTMGLRQPPLKVALYFGSEKIGETFSLKRPITQEVNDFFDAKNNAWFLPNGQLPDSFVHQFFYFSYKTLLMRVELTKKGVYWFPTSKYPFSINEIPKETNRSFLFFDARNLQEFIPQLERLRKPFVVL